MKKKLLVLGAGGHGKVVADIACDMRVWDEICFLDDRYPSVSEVGIWRVIGQLKDLAGFQSDFTDAIVAIGDGRTRVEWLNKCMEAGFHTPVIAHRSAEVSRMAKIGPGSVLIAQSAVNADALVGMAGIINTGTTVGHDCNLAEGVHIAPGANLAGGVSVGDFSWVGIGAKVIQNISIGADVMVGAGAVVVRDVEDGVMVFGNPARVVRKRPSKEGLGAET